MRDRLNISVRPVSPVDELNVLSRRPEPARHTIHERYKIVAVSAPEQSPRSFSSAELSHTFLSLNLCREIIRRVSTPDPRPVAFLARGREAVTRAKSTAGHAAASAGWVEFARGTRPVRKRVPVASVAVRYDVEARMSVKVDERVCARRTHSRETSNANTRTQVSTKNQLMRADCSEAIVARNTRKVTTRMSCTHLRSFQGRFCFCRP